MSDRPLLVSAVYLLRIAVTLSRVVIHGTYRQVCRCSMQSVGQTDRQTDTKTRDKRPGDVRPSVRSSRGNRIATSFDRIPSPIAAVNAVTARRTGVQRRHWKCNDMAATATLLQW